MNEPQMATNSKALRAGVLQTFNDRLSTIVGQNQNVIDLLDQVLASAFGDGADVRPIGASERPCRPGVTGQIEDQIDTLTEQVETLMNRAGQLRERL